MEEVQQKITNRIGSLNSERYELLGEAFASKADVTTAQRNGIPFLIMMMWKILHNVVPNCSNIRFTKTSAHMVP